MKGLGDRSGLAAAIIGAGAAILAAVITILPSLFSEGRADVKSSTGPVAVKVVERESPSSNPEYSAEAVIDDDDGFVNVRSLQEAGGEIVDVIQEGEVFYTHPQAGGWWHVRTARGKYGYVHSTRLRVLEDRLRGAKDPK